MKLHGKRSVHKDGLLEDQEIDFDKGGWIRTARDLVLEFGANWNYFGGNYLQYDKKQ